MEQEFLSTSQFDKRMDEFAAMVQGGFNGVTQKLDKIELRLDRVELEIVEIKRTVQEMDQRLTSRIDSIATHLDEFATLVKGMQLEQVATRSMYQRLEARLEAVEQKLGISAHF